MTIEEVLSNEERQIFDRKSINIEPKALAVPLIAFANADGGTIAIGISDKTRRIEGTDFEIQKLNELLRVPYDFCEPSVPVQIETLIFFIVFLPLTQNKIREHIFILFYYILTRKSRALSHLIQKSAKMSCSLRMS